MNPLLRWPVRMVAMSAGYAVGGPVGGLVGLGVASWLSRSKPGDADPPARPAIPPDIRAAYRTLEVKPRVSNEELRATYRRLMNRHHPDKLGPDATPAQRDAAHRRARDIQQAYARLRQRRGF